MDIYQAIWDADMNGNGIHPILSNEDGDQSEGYVIVDTKIQSREHRFFKEVHIPDKKKNSYHLVSRLFDNYRLNQVNREQNSAYESKEVEEFLNMAIHSSPIKIAKAFIEEQCNRTFNETQWFTYLYNLWFQQFDWESGRDLSGFEHVFIGEQKKKELAGHHFWYKYWLEDNAALNPHRLDQIELARIDQYKINPGEPYVLTAGYYVKAFDYSKRRFIKIFKKRCAFFVGLSAEGLLALGTVRALPKEDVPQYVVLNNVHYKIELYMSPDGKSIRTFYPVYVLE